MPDVNQLFQKAHQLYKKGRKKDACKLYQKIVKQAPRLVGAINMYGITLAELGELPAAANQFSNILNIEPKNLSAHENLSRVYMLMHEYAKAQTIYERALELSPKSYKLQYGLACSQMSQNNISAALKSFDSARVLDESDPALFVNMGTTLSQLGRNQAAGDAFKQAITLDPNMAEAYLRLGQLQIVEGRYIDAEETLFKASQIQGDNYHINLSLADAYQHNSKDELAIKHYLIADQLHPKTQNVYTKLDKLFLHTGSDEKKALLDEITQPYIYDDWLEPINQARRLAQLLEYPDKTALTTLHQFFERYDPAILHTREWWQQELKLFGDEKSGHDKILRGIHSAVFSWSIPDEQTLSSIADFINDTRLYSYGAGSALWERLLMEHFNIDVVATDFEPRHSYLPIAAEDYAISKVPENDSIFFSWIIRGDTGALNILNQLKSGQKLVLIGEPRDELGIPRICATPEIFDLLDSEFTLSKSIPLVSYSMLNDTVSLYIKN